jgi:restriction system protein
MARKSDLENMAEVSIKAPWVGLAMSLFFLFLGFYCTVHSQATNDLGSVFTSAVLKPVLILCYVLAGLSAIFSIAGFVKRNKKKKAQDSFYFSKNTLHDLKQLSGKEFEKFVGTLFEKLGYAVEVTGGVKDGGVDLIVKKDSTVYLVQCKQYRISQVTLSMVRDFYGAMASRRNVQKGFFVTTGIFTLDASKFAAENFIEAIDGARLMEYVAMARMPAA